MNGLKNSSQFQRLLERQADYLLEPNTWWREVDSGVEFFDTNTVLSTKKLHHFRSTTLKADSIYLQECWTLCLLEKNKLIPTFKLKLPEKVVYLSTLNHFADKAALKISEDVDVECNNEKQFPDFNISEINDNIEISIANQSSTTNLSTVELFNCSTNEINEALTTKNLNRN